jgi:hypothetical protein
MHINDVHALRLERAKVNHQTYKDLFRLCCERIRRRAGVRNSPAAMHYQVPPFVWGRPPFQHTHAVRYVSEKLSRNGFRVTPSPAQAGMLLVEWGHAAPAAVATAHARSAPKSSLAAAKTRKKPAKKLSARLAALRKQFG